MAVPAFPPRPRVERARCDMPLKKGKSPKVISANIEEGIKSAKASGKFGNQKGPLKQLLPSIKAAAYTSARKSGRNR